MTKIKAFFSGLSKLGPLYFLVLAIIFGVICIVSLRANNQHMAQLKTAVYQADKNNGNVQLALDNLQAYVTAHMNTDLTTGNGSVYPPIQLEYTYNRLSQAAETAVVNANSGLYTAAQAYCQQQDPVDFSGRNRVPCIEKYVQGHGAVIPTIPTALYQFDFISPTWSPDLAGWSMLATLLSFIATFALYGLGLYRKYL